MLPRPPRPPVAWDSLSIAYTPLPSTALQTAAVELQQLGHVLFGLGPRRRREARGWRRGPPMLVTPATNFIRSSAMSSLRRAPSRAVHNPSIDATLRKPMLADRRSPHLFPARSHTAQRLQMRMSRGSTRCFPLALPTPLIFTSACPSPISLSAPTFPAQSALPTPRSPPPPAARLRRPHCRRAPRSTPPRPSASPINPAFSTPSSRLKPL